MNAAALDAWEFDPACDVSDVARLAAEGIAPPSFSGRLVSERGDALTLQVVQGGPSGDAGSLYWVAGHGAFTLTRREVWPPAPGDERERVLLTLRAVGTARELADPPSP